MQAQPARRGACRATRRVGQIAFLVLRFIRYLTRGLVYCHAGEDEASSSLTNVSVGKTLSDAQQMDSFESMLAFGRSFGAKGATFEQPLMNYSTPWEIVPGDSR